MDVAKIDRMLTLIRAQSDVAAGKVARPQDALGNAAGVDKTGGFGEALKASLDQVNQTQQSANALGQAFESGTSTASLAEVMIAMQKASISFQATVQVRNKLVSAYQDIMNMPV
jgi:flagellar hook-basal body complex protein FliE